LNIGPNTVAAVDVELQDLWGNVLQKTDEPLLYLHGGGDGLLPALERALDGKAEGERLEVRLEPEDAFGDYEPELLRVEPREAFPEVLQVGMRFEGVPGDAPAEELVVYTVTGIADEQVVVDGNHPLAGERVLFKCTVREVRPATREELRHGHAHGEHSPEEEEG